MTAQGAIGRGLAAVNAVRDGAPLTQNEVVEEHIADAIADLLHLAEHLELDVDAVLEHGRSYYQGDVDDPDPDSGPTGPATTPSAREEGSTP